MIGAAIGAGLSAATSIIGAMQNRKAMQEYSAGLAAQRASNQAWYDRNYNADPLARVSAQRLMTAVGDRMKRANRAAAGTRAVMGGTEESVAATREANSQAMASAAAGVASMNDARQDALEKSYMARDNALADRQQSLQMAKAQNIAEAVKGVGQAAGSIATGLDAPTATGTATGTQTGAFDPKAIQDTINQKLKITS